MTTAVDYGLKAAIDSKNSVSQPGFREKSLGVPREIVIEKKNNIVFLTCWPK
jgi:hypothetical protein